MSIIYCFALILLAVAQTAAENLVCYSKTKNESVQIYRYFYGIHEGFYFDIAPDYPIQDSNTIFLRSQGWNGLNLLTSTAKFVQFTKSRRNQINIFAQIAANTNISSAQNQGEQNFATPISQICANFITRKPQFLSVNTKHLNSFLSTNNWGNEKCKPQLILVRQTQPQLAITDKMKQNLIEHGYKLANSQGQISLFVEKSQSEKYQKRYQSNLRINPNNIASFSWLLRNLQNKFETSQAKVEGNKLGNNGLINFASYNSNVDVEQLVKASKQYDNEIIKYLVVMQFNPSTNRVIVEASTYEISYIAVGNQHKYYRIIYQPFKQPNRTIQIYIFDHQFIAYDVNEIQVVTMLQGEEEQQTVTTTTGKKGKSDKQKKEQQQLIEKARIEATIESKRWGKIKQVKNKNNQVNTTLATMTLQPKIQNLTPENILADEQIINRTILVIVLISTVLGSIFLTAVVTACVMKKRHKAHVRSRITHNADLNVEQFSQNNATEPKSQTQH